ncbi:MAG: hypothetical protein OXC62_16060 [Aestuariivita sp.]|nr:hypothetical protein [Aestuariivita sp.]
MASFRLLMLSTSVPQVMDIPDRVDRVSRWTVQLIDTKAKACFLAR